MHAIPDLSAEPDGIATRPRQWFDAVDVRTLKSWLSSDFRGAGLRIVLDAPVETREVYYDTVDWRMHAAGLTLSVRSRAGRQSTPVMAVMDSLPSEERSGTALGRVEQVLPEAGRAALREGSGPVTDRVLALAGQRPLEPRVEMHVVETAAVIVRAGTPAARILLVRVTVPFAADQRPIHLDRIAVEMPADDDREMNRLLDALRQGFGLRPAVGPRYGVALQALGLSPPAPPDLGSPTVDRSMTVGAVAMAVLRRHFARMCRHEPGTRLGEDPEELHDMRVAIRRMRAALKLFARYLPARALALRGELAWLGRVLGSVRDLDVQIAGVRMWAARLEPADREAFEALCVPLAEQRAAARRQLLRTLNSRRYERLLGRMTAVLVRGPLQSHPEHQLPILAVAPQLIERCAARINKGRKGMSKSSPATAFHRLRIRFKALRYVLEFHRGVYGKASEAVIKQLVDAQDLLGQHQDADVAVAWLRNVLDTEGRRLPPQTLFAAGLIAERYARRARNLRRQYLDKHGTLKGRRWSRLVRVMKARERAAHRQGRRQ